MKLSGLVSILNLAGLKIFSDRYSKSSKKYARTVAFSNVVGQLPRYVPRDFCIWRHNVINTLHNVTKRQF